MRGRLVAAGALAAAAALLAAAGTDALRLRAATRRDDVRFEAGGAGAGLWRGRGLSARILGVRDDLAYRRALERFRRGHGRRTGTIGTVPGLNTTAGARSDAAILAARADAHDELERLAAADSDDVRRGRAAALLGVLLVEDAQRDRPSAPLLLAQAGQAFRAGALAGDADAKYDLELLLDLTGARRRVGRSAASIGVFTEATQADLALSGRGY